MRSDLRVCFLGDSYVAGIGDPEHLGWVGRIAARHSQATGSLTAYNLGVRGETSKDVRGRWRAECTPRLSSAEDCRMVVSFGVDDTTDREGRRRVDRARSAAHLSALLSDVADAGWPILVGGPPPVAGDAQHARVGELDEDFQHVCTARGCPTSRLSPSCSAPRRGCDKSRPDGAHPAASGYRVLSDLVRPAWEGWLG